MKNKIKRVFTLVMISLGMTLVSCSSKVPGVDSSGVNCKIELLKENSLTSPRYESNVITVGTRFYILVSFTLLNCETRDDVIDFSVSIPGAEFYSVTDCVRGHQEPKKDIIPNGDIDVIKLSDMQFTISNGGIKYHYDYIFELSGSQPHDNLQFRAKFTSDYNMIDNDDQHTFVQTYSFVEPEE